MNDTAQLMATLLAVAVIAVLAPLLLGPLPWLRVPQVVLLLLGGMIVGPQLLAIARPGDVQPLSDIGSGSSSCSRDTRSTNASTARTRAGGPCSPGRLPRCSRWPSPAGWPRSARCGRSCPSPSPSPRRPSALVPILREGGLLGGRLGGFLLAAGAVKELLPIVAIALLFGVDNRFVALIALGGSRCCLCCSARSRGWCARAAGSPE